MPNLEQQRAKNALDWSGVQTPEGQNANAGSVRKHGSEGDALSGYPALIIGNGLLASLAFSIQKEKQHLRIANAIAFHLHDMKIARRSSGRPDAEWLRDYLSGRAQDTGRQYILTNAFTLRHATDEAMAFLSYLKRFAKSGS